MQPGGGFGPSKEPIPTGPVGRSRRTQLRPPSVLPKPDRTGSAPATSRQQVRGRCPRPSVVDGEGREKDWPASVSGVRESACGLPPLTWGFPGSVMIEAKGLTRPTQPPASVSVNPVGIRRFAVPDPSFRVSFSRGRKCRSRQSPCKPVQVVSLNPPGLRVLERQAEIGQTTGGVPGPRGQRRSWASTCFRVRRPHPRCSLF